MSVREKYILENHFHHKGIRSSQHKKASSVFNKTILKKFSRIIELGSGKGAFTMLLSKSGSDVIGYESSKEFFQASPIPKNVKVIFKDYNKEEISIKKQIQKKGKTLLLLDGGQKINDFHKFSKYLKKDDVIMIHDYGDDAETFRRKAEAINWLWGQEVKLKNIQPTIESIGLKKWEFDRFSTILWGAFIKE